MDMGVCDEYVILVNESDAHIGSCEKMDAHKTGQLHRAFSIFIVNAFGNLLLQKRARTKYHSGGLWTNTCCGHPRPGEALLDAAYRRLHEEMGISCVLSKISHFMYRTTLDRGLVENELDHVIVGYSDENPCPNPAEAEDWKWISSDALAAEIDRCPEQFTAWFKIIMQGEVCGNLWSKLLQKQTHSCLS